MKKHFVKLVILFTLAIALVACNNNKSNNTIVVNITADPGSLDPNLANGTWEHWLFSNVFEGLVAFDVNGVVVPAMAKDWTITNNGKTYTFNLRNAKWSNGEPVTAHDFEYSFKRVLNPETAAQYAEQMYIIKGAKEYNTGKASANDVMVKALDDKTLQITLNFPAVYFIEMIEHPIFSPIPKNIVQKYGKNWAKQENIAFNGAYKITKWQPQSHLMATKNPMYYNANNVEIENIKFVTIDQADKALEGFRAKQIDFSYDFPADKIDLVKQQLNGEWFIESLTGLYFFTINVSHKQLAYLKNPEIRDALSMVINRELIVNNITKTGEIPAYSIVPTQLYNPIKDSTKLPSTKWVKLDINTRIANAKKIMSKHGFSQSNPLNVKLAYNIGDENKRVAVAVANMWKEIGVKTEFEISDINVHYDNLQAGNFELGRARWIGDYPEPSSVLYLLEEGKALNFGKYYNQQFEKLVLTAKSTANKKESLKYYAQAEQIALNQTALMPVFFVTARTLSSKKIKGFKPYLGGVYLFKHYKLQNN